MGGFAAEPTARVGFMSDCWWPRAALSTARQKRAFMTPGGRPRSTIGEQSGTPPSDAACARRPAAHPAEKDAQPAGMNLHGHATCRYLGANLCPLTTRPLLFFTLKARATCWMCSVARLQRWRTVGEGPPYLKIVGKVLYRAKDIEAYEEACLIRKVL